MNTGYYVESLISEYQSLIDVSNSDTKTVTNVLVTDADWSERAADELLFLATHYGSFVLRNALALSVTLGIEDGECGL